ncbi:GNAT family N-acetyltransferase [Salegentibacter sp. LM13S]|uniref:GNAT family N-acetyltransferase n=1 Tax=Salegentibacter lacus TaxID=2873599 RepID=UPI001CCB3C96|nr:GNAT family N-acetyltransferase [Salegentibacter lacus]MBZ9631504.1 GNAT family N-acetyltransferase [Salegentibacter lacus]
MKDFEILEWDSEFFGFKVAKIASNISDEHYQKILSQLHKEEVELIYFNSNFDVSESEYYTVLKIDEIVELSKELKLKKEFHPKVKFFDQTIPTTEMRNLLKRIARRSRFYFDDKIPNSKVYELYDIWLDKSVKHIGADAVLVYQDDDEVKGFATIRFRNNGEGIIPLMGVDAKSEGKGISFLLMEAIESYLIERNCSVLKSSTQSRNLKALKVYERFGIKCERGFNINHLWRKSI